MALLHRDRTEEHADTRLGDERLMGEPPVEGPATVDRDSTVDRDIRRDRDVVAAPTRMETWGLIIRTAVFTLAVAAIVAVSTENLGDVNLDMVFEQYATPLWVPIALSAAIGCIAGLMVRPRRWRRDIDR
jgi:uncharacterized integral membrane protein